MKPLTLLTAIPFLVFQTGCLTTTYHGGGWDTLLDATDMRIFVAPFQSATGEDNAAPILTDLTTTALLERGLPIIQTEETLWKSRQDAGSPVTYEAALKLARESEATHVLVGTVHEYRYKTDLNGDPAVGMTLRLVEMSDGKTVWQGSSSKVGFAFASLSSTAQKVVRKLVNEMPVRSAARPAR